MKCTAAVSVASRYCCGVGKAASESERRAVRWPPRHQVDDVAAVRRAAQPGVRVFGYRPAETAPLDPNNRGIAARSQRPTDAPSLTYDRCTARRRTRERAVDRC